MWRSPFPAVGESVRCTQYGDDFHRVGVVTRCKEGDIEVDFGHKRITLGIEDIEIMARQQTTQE